MRIDQSYDPLEVESGRYDFWREGGYFRADPHSERPPYAIVIPPPNVTGTLHMGHALFATLQDILIRYHRMRGFEALWVPGTDHAGIATQVVVERLLKAEGTTRHEIGREKFLERAWAWKEESGGRIVEQLKRLGASCDWERERFTLDEGLSRAVRVMFKRLYDDGLIFRGDRMVNWDPSTQTVLSDLEVITSKDGERGSFWYIRYPLADGSGQITIGTTRPETMLGDAAVAVHPDDERYRELIGRELILPLVGRRIPIIADAELADPEKGSGAVKVTPAHDPNDYECGLRHDLELRRVIDLDASMRGPDVPEAYQGLDRYEARRRIVAALKEADLLDRVEAITYFPGRSERTGTVVEPLVMKQWFVRGEEFARPAREAVERGETRIIPALWKKTYDHFMYNIRDWCISRQLWWGHRIPAWYAPSGEVFVAESAEQARAEAEARLGAGVELVQDPDVLDTWFSSALWPFSVLGWPEETPELEKFYPTAVLETGSDILFFWVARMMMAGMYAMGEVPFRDVFLHAMVRDERGEKMSKLKGNIIDPLHLIHGASRDELDPALHKELIAKIERDKLTVTRDGAALPGVATQGADALRFTLAVLAAQGRDVKLDISRMEGYRAFLNKLWNAARFVLMNRQDYEPEPYERFAGEWGDELSGAPLSLELLSDADRWILHRSDRAVRAVEEALSEYRFNDAAQAIYHFVWHELCDWYIELVKPTLYDDSESGQGARCAALSTLDYLLDVSLRMLHPFAPFITEDIWLSFERSGQAPSALIVAPWPPARDELARMAPEARRVERVLEMITAVRAVRGETGVKPSVRIARAWAIVDDPELAAEVRAGRALLERQAKIEELVVVGSDQADEIPSPAATSHAAGVELRIPLRGLIDVEAERARLDKAIERVASDIEHVEKKLNNPKFVERAPAALVEAERAKRAQLGAERSALDASRSALAALES